MGKKNRNIFQKSIGRIFYQLTKKEANKLYKDKLKELRDNGIEVTKEMNKELREECVKKSSKEVKRKAKARGVVVAIFGLGALAGMGSTLALNPAVEGVKENKSKNQIEINLDETESEIVFTGSIDSTKAFRKEIADSVISQEARNKANKEISEARTKEDILNIVKGVVAEQWNAVNDEKITDMSLIKTSETTILYKDIAENGDEIIKFREWTSKESLREEGKNTLRNNTMIQVIIQTEDGKYNIQVTPQNGEYVTVYDESEKVSKYEPNFICKSGIGDLVQDGIEWAIAEGQDGTSWGRKDEYENDFRESLTKYYNENAINMMNNYFTNYTTSYTQESNENGIEPGE